MIIQGTNFNIQAVPYKPYITRMNPINVEGDVFEMDGLFAEIWFNLQVSIHSLYIRVNLHICIIT